MNWKIFVSGGNDSTKRSWIKSLVWRGLGIVILVGISYLVTKNWETVTLITVIFHGIRFVMYYFHERIWDSIEWGRVNGKSKETRK